MILKPPVPSRGDRVGVVAPAGPVSVEKILPGIQRLESLGWTVVPGPHLYNTGKLTAGTDEERLRDLHAMFADPGIRGIFCARGGYGSLRLLPLLDMDLIRSSPKVFMGCSDITALLMGIHAATGLVSFHGPVVRGLAEDPEGNLDVFLGWAADPATPPSVDLGGTCRVLRPGTGSGPVLGGNLSLVTHLLGTGHMPDVSGALLFLEDVNEPLYRIDRMLTHLRLAGVFERISGFLAGDFGGSEISLEVDELLVDCVGSLDMPVIGGFPVGHGRKNLPVPVGLEARLDTDRMTLSYQEPCFSSG